MDNGWERLPIFPVPSSRTPGVFVDNYYLFYQLHSNGWLSAFWHILPECLQAVLLYRWVGFDKIFFFIHMGDSLQECLCLLSWDDIMISTQFFLEYIKETLVDQNFLSAD